MRGRSAFSGEQSDADTVTSKQSRDLPPKTVHSFGDLSICVTV